MMQTDLESIDYVCTLVSDIGEYLPRGGTLVRRPDAAFVEGQHFTAELRLIPDYEREVGVLSIQIRLRRRGRGKHSDRDLYVRFQSAAQRLGDPRLWRNVVKQLMAVKHRRHRRLSWSLQASREIYWTTEVVREDLKAQILIALIQLGCVPSNSDELRSWLAGYISRTYRIRIDRAVPKSELAQARDAVAFLAADNILRNWVCPEDYRAFRFYASKVVRHELRVYLGPHDLQTDSRRTDERDRRPEPSWNPREEKEEPESSSLSRAWRVGSPVLKEQMSVAEVAAYLNLTPTYVPQTRPTGQAAGYPW